jgi:hypothetical protein
VVAVVVAAELARDVVVLARGPAAAVALRELALLRAARLLAATTWLRRVLAALLVAALLVAAPRVQPVELLNPSFSAATARTTR